MDFAHTGGEGRWAVFERLHAPVDLRDWLFESSLELRVERIAITAGDVEAARRLRSEIWNAAQAVVHERRFPRIPEILAAAAHPDLVPVLARGRRAWAPGATTRQTFSNIARDAIALFGSDVKERLRECRNPDCPLLFLDLSRPGRRSWCSMQRCGNLKKTARYRRKKKGES